MQEKCKRNLNPYVDIKKPYVNRTYDAFTESTVENIKLFVVIKRYTDIYLVKLDINTIQNVCYILIM